MELKLSEEIMEERVGIHSEYHLTGLRTKRSPPKPLAQCQTKGACLCSTFSIASLTDCSDGENISGFLELGQLKQLQAASNPFCQALQTTLSCIQKEVGGRRITRTALQVADIATTEVPFLFFVVSFLPFGFPHCNLFES